MVHSRSWVQSCKRRLVRLTLPLYVSSLVLSGVSPGIPAAIAAGEMCNGLAATIVGTSGNNVLNGTAGNDVIVGLGGHDTINGLGGNDTICGGMDGMVSDGNDTITTVGGNDWINAGDGNNTVVAGAGTNTVTSGGGNDAITTGNDDDTINAGDGANNIAAGAGTNTVISGGGSDTITTGNGDDTINAGNGANDINAGAGTNSVTTGSGNDDITTGNGNDTINAGDGTNDINAGAGNNVVNTGNGNDDVITGNGNDVITLGNGTNGSTGNRIQSGGGDDSIVGGTGNDHYDGGSGTDFCDPVGTGINNTTINCETVGSNADLSVVKVAPESGVSGDTLTYTITVDNAGPQDATNVALTDVLPAGTTFVSFTAPGGWSTTTPPVGGTGTVSATKPTVAVADPADVFTLVVMTTTCPATVENTATIDSDTEDTNTSNDSSTDTTDVTCPGPVCEPDDATLVGYWKLDEASGTVSADSSGNANDGTHLNGPTISSDTAPTTFTNPNSLLFDGSNDAVQVDDAATLDLGAHTVSAWVKPTVSNAGANDVIVAKGGTGFGNYNYLLYFSTANNNTVTAYSSGLTPPVLDGAPILANVWSHVAMTYDGTTRTVYVNGLPVATDTPTGTPTMGGGLLEIAASDNGLFNFPGNVDDVRVYNAALGAQEILDLAGGACEGEPAVCGDGDVEGSEECDDGNLVDNDACSNSCEENDACVPTDATLAGYWKFDEAAASLTAADSTTFDNAGGHLNGVTTGVTGAPALTFSNPAAASFDGTDDYTLVPVTTGLPTGNDPRTLMTWLNMDTLGYQSTLISLGNGATGDQRFIFMVGNEPISGPTYVFTDGLNGANNIVISGSDVPATGGWHHIAFSYDGVGNWAYYLDGVLKQSGVFPVAINTVTNAVEIGSRHDSATGYFDGALDDVRIYGSVLSAEDIADIAGGACEPGDTPPVTQCNDGVDNDDPEDTLVDELDPGCENAEDNDETNSPPIDLPECSDGVDNGDAEDSLVDMADPGCSNPEDDDETNGPICDGSDEFVYSVSHTCTDSPGSQLCAPPYDAIDPTVDYDAAYYFSFDVADGHCSSIRVHIYADGVPQGTSDWLGTAGAPPQVYGPIFIGNYDANHAVDIDIVAEGMVGGCNSGSLSSWGGTATVTTEEICSEPQPTMDFGDAPDTSGNMTLLPGGARHTVVDGWTLGETIDAEADGQPSAEADGDGSDEDGVTFTDPLVLDTTVEASVTVHRPSCAIEEEDCDGYLEGWIDFDQDGVWENGVEHVFDEEELTDGAHTLTFTVPDNAALGATYARFRWSDVGGEIDLGLTPSGPADEGEVEDYKVMIVEDEGGGDEDGQCVQDDLFAHWKLDEGTGTTAIDSTGNGHTGTHANGPTYGPGTSVIIPNPSALNFDGSDDVVNVPATGFDFGNQNFTLAGWIKTTVGNRSILGHFDNQGSGYRGYGMYVYDGNQLNAFGYGDMGVNDTAKPAVILDNNWHHVAAVYTRSGNDLTITFYVDGSFIGDSTATVGNIAIATPFLLGKYTFQPNFEGGLDDVRVYDRALSSGEIGQLAINCGITGGDEGGGPSINSFQGDDGTGGPIGGGHGNYIGHRLNELTFITNSAFNNTILQQNGGNTPPPAFGGSQNIFTGIAFPGFGGSPDGTDGEMTEMQTQVICRIQAAMDHNDDFNAAISWLAEKLSPVFGLSADVIAEALRNDDLCAEHRSLKLGAHVLAGKGFLKPFLVKDGRPYMPGYVTFNACMGDDVTLQDIRGNTETNEGRRTRRGIIGETPLGCSDYVAKRDKDGTIIGRLPGRSFEIFEFNPKTGVIVPPDGYEVMEVPSQL